MAISGWLSVHTGSSTVNLLWSWRISQVHNCSTEKKKRRILCVCNGRAWSSLGELLPTLLPLSVVGIHMGNMYVTNFFG